MAAVQRIPLFPLTSHVLPGGQLRLRIFEPRYLRMVKQAIKDDVGVGICMLDAFGDKENNSHILPLGTYSKVIDFEMLPDGLLGITVLGLQRFRVNDIETESDGLRFGHVEMLENWPEESISDDDTCLRHRIEEIYREYPELVQLSPEQHILRTDWLCMRWLEILPLDPHTKQNLLDDETCLKAKNYIRGLIQ